MCFYSGTCGFKSPNHAQGPFSAIVSLASVGLTLYIRSSTITHFESTHATRVETSTDFATRVPNIHYLTGNSLIKKLCGPPKGINDRLMTLRIPLVSKKHATIISAYAPTMTNSDDVKDKFYEDLDNLLKSVPSQDKLLLLGDFNARVGSDYKTWEGVLGKNGVGNSNSNGLQLLRTCTEHKLLITNTVFRLPLRNRTSWMHPRSKHWHLIDYLITRAKDNHDVRVTKAMCGADCWTDHRLIISKLKFRIQPPRRPQGKKASKRLNTNKLLLESVSQKLSEDLDSKLTGVTFNNTDLNENWSALRDVVYQTSLEHLGPTQRKHQDWFDENNGEIQDLLEKKHYLHKTFLNDPSSQSKRDAYKAVRRTVQAKLRKMKDTWYSRRAEEIQSYAESNNSRCFYNALKTIYGPQSSGSSPVLSADGSTLYTDKDKILKRWAEHFNNVLNRPSSINEAAIARLPQAVPNMTLVNTISEDEVLKATNRLLNGKAPGADAIPGEIFKKGGPKLITKLTELFNIMLHQESIPQEFKDASLVHLYKRKGNRRCCDNHRGISLLAIAGKILARVLLNRLLNHLEQDLLPESQCGFREGRGTIDMIFAARQLQEKCQEQHRDLYTTFIDLTKAFDTVSRAGLWKIMAKFGCPDKFTALVRSFHDGMQVRVQDDGESSEPILVTNGVKQGCVLAPTLFSMMFSAMLAEAFRDNSDGISIRFRTDGKLFNLRRLHAKTKVKMDRVRDLLFADDCALNACSEPEMQQSMDKFSSACDAFGLTISTKKTEVMYQPAPNKDYTVPTINVNGEALKTVNKFTYLGSTLSRNVRIDDEVVLRIAKASAAFGNLREKVWEREGLSTQTKLKVYKAVILPSLLYSCETWTVYSRHLKSLNSFHLKCLRKILKICWQDKVPDTEVLHRADMTSIHTLISKNQLRWSGHVVRMDDNRLPKRVFYGELATGKRTTGGQYKRYKDTLKASLKNFNINPDTWENLAAIRTAWRSEIRRGATQHENIRIKKAEDKRAERKNRMYTESSIPNSTDFVCHTCQRHFRARIGLISHTRTHQPKN